MFVDLENAYDKVTREEVWYCMRKSGVAEKCVRIVQDMYGDSITAVRCAVGVTEGMRGILLMSCRRSAVRFPDQAHGMIRDCVYLCLSDETLKSRWSLLSGVYARGSKRSRTGGKCVTCRGLHILA